MMHDVKTVARNNFFDPVKFEAYAVKTKYVSEGMVSSWWVDDLVKEYRNDTDPAVLKADREYAYTLIKRVNK